MKLLKCDKKIAIYYFAQAVEDVSWEWVMRKQVIFLSLICLATIMKLYNIIRSDQLNIAELFMSKYKQ